MSTTTALTAEQVEAARIVREIHNAAHAMLRAANDRGPTGRDLAAFSDAMREVQARENAMLSRWWPGAAMVYVSKVGGVEVNVWPTTNPDDGLLLTEVGAT